MREVFNFRNSSNVVSCEYDDEEQTLDVTFASGDTYRYDSVPQSTYRSFTLAGSPGSFVHQRLKREYNGYPI